MAMGRKVRVIERNIKGIYTSGGSGHRWIGRLGDEYYRLAKAMTPKGPSRNHKSAPQEKLINSYGTDHRGSNQYTSQARVFNTAEHSVYVHDGTNGPIVPKSSDYMNVPIRSGAEQYYRAKAVRGQKAQPWMTEAARIVFDRYR